MAWEVGQKVILSDRNGKYIRTVSKVTKTGRCRIVNSKGVEHHRLFKVNGSMSGGGAWNHTSIRAATEDEIESLREQSRLRSVQNKIKKILTRGAVGDLTLDQCQAILAIMEPS